MTALNHYKRMPVLFGNINHLCSLLRQSKSEYELMAVALSDEALSRTILTLAQMNNQYACELSALLQTLGGTPQKQKMQELKVKADAQDVRDENATLHYCKQKGKKLVKAYQKLLRKTYLNKGMRNMVHYQLVGMRSAFVQLQLLSSLQSH